MPRANDAFPEMDSMNLHKLLDDKVALSPAYTYDGGSGGEHWRRKIRGYWVAKCPALLPLLDWAEAMDDECITQDELFHVTVQKLWMKKEHTRRMDEIIWGS